MQKHAVILFDFVWIKMLHILIICKEGADMIYADYALNSTIHVARIAQIIESNNWYLYDS